MTSISSSIIRQPTITIAFTIILKISHNFEFKKTVNFEHLDAKSRMPTTFSETCLNGLDHALTIDANLFYLFGSHCIHV